MEPRVTEGTLETADGRVLPLEWTKVQAKIHGPLATVEVRQSFKNPTAETLEATYLFPLPHQASVFRMEFRIAGRVVRGVVKEKEEARRTYEAARAQGRAATLLEQERPNLFTLSVANIAPKATIEVLLEYQELVAIDDGEWRFVFPMLASERYHSSDGRSAAVEVPDGARIRPPRARQKERFSPISLQVQLAAPAAMERPKSPSHHLNVERVADGYQVGLSEGQSVPNRDFVLAWRPQGRGLHPQIWFERESDKPGTFCVCLPAPPPAPTVTAPEAPSGKGVGCGNCGAPLESKEAIEDVPGLGSAWRCEYCGVYHRLEPAPKPSGNSGRDVIFLVDQSASMKSLGAAPSVVLRTLSLLNESDAFQIIGFHHDLTRLTREWLPCDGPSRKKAEEFLLGLQSRGGTELEATLRAAGEKQRDGRTRVVVLLTDAAVGNEGRLLRQLPEWLEESRLFVLGLGPSVNRYLIDKLAHHGKGAYDVAVAGEPEVIERFANRVSQAGPILTGLSISLLDSTAMDVYPRGDLELFSGQALRLTGRFVGSGPARLLVTGFTPDGSSFRQELEVELPEAASQAPGLERVWARQRLEDLQDQLTRRPERLSEVRLEVLGLALKHQLMSPYTALVAEDSERSVDPSAPSRRVEVELPTPFAQGASSPAPATYVGVEPGVLESSAPGREAGPGGPKMGGMLRSTMMESDGLVGWGSDTRPAPSSFPRPMACSAPAPPTGRPAPPSAPPLPVACRAARPLERGAAPPSAPPPHPRPEFEREPEACFDEAGDVFGGGGVEPVSPDDLFGSDDPFAPAHDPFAHDPYAYAPDPFADADPFRPLDPATLKRHAHEDGRTYIGAPSSNLQGQARPAQPRVVYSPEELARARDLVQGRLDLVFLIDETGSMGPYIQQVQAHLLTLIQSLRESPLCRSLRLGLVTYRDHPPQEASFVTRVVPLTAEISQVQEGVRRMRAHGGGDGPEAVTDGLHDLLSLDWDAEAARMVVMVGDAPPHGVEPEGDGFPEGCPCGRHWYTQAESCREMGITVHCVGCQGILQFVGAVEVFKSVAKATGGLYLPLDQAEMLIKLVTGLADRELDRQRVEQYVAEVYAAHQQVLEQSDPAEQARFITETLQARGVQILDLQDNRLDLAFRPLHNDDIALALESVLRRQTVMGRV